MLAFGKFRLSSFAGHRLGAPKLWPVACDLWPKGSSGQALVETALIVPFLLMIALNVINFGYFFLMAVNLAAAPRSGGLYSILGGSTPASAIATFPGLAPAGSATTTTSVTYLTYQDLTGAVYQPTNNGSVQVCSTTACAAGVACVQGSGTSTESECQTFGGTPSYTFPSVTYDPENNGSTPMFYLNRVDIAYQFTPLIPGTPFNIVLLASNICKSGTCIFHQQAVMREMN
jgi:Flp pilus assembly protein TadG